VDTIDDIREGAGAAGGTKPPRMARRRIAAAAALALTGGLLAGAAPARADLAPALSQLLQALPGQSLTVIVNLAAQVDPALYPGDPVGLLTAQHALADQTQQAIADAAGVPVVSLWSINALTLTASAETIARLAAMPGVARVDVDPMAQIAPIPTQTTATPVVPQIKVQTATQVSPTVRQMTITVPSAPVAPLRVLSVVQRRTGSVRSLLVRVELDRPATVRAELRTGALRIAGSRVRRLTAGRVAIVVVVPPQGIGALRLRVSGRGAAGSLIGPAVERAIRIAA
jgi:hypothetical protein